MAGVARDLNLYVWSISDNAVGAEARRVNMTLEIGESDPVVRFSDDGRFFAYCAFDGSLYVWNLEAPTRDLALPRAMVRHGSGKIRLAFSKDAASMLSADRVGVYFGPTQGEMTRVLGSQSQPEQLLLGPDRHELIVLAARHVEIVRRKLFFWGLPLYDLRWPEFAFDGERG